MVTKNKEPEKTIKNSIGYRKVPNRIHDRMIDNSLAHNFIVPDDENLKKKVLVKTKIFNRLLRLNSYSYNRYVQLKKKMIEFLADVENIESLDNIDCIFDKFVFPADEEPIEAVKDISDDSNDSESADSVDGDLKNQDRGRAGAETDIEDDKSLLVVDGQDEVEDVNAQDDEVLVTERNQENASQDDKSLVSGNNVDETSGPGHEIDDHGDKSSGPGHSLDKIDDQVDETSEPGYSQDIFDESLESSHGDDKIDELSRSGHKIDDQVDESSRPGHKVDDQADESSRPGHSQDIFDESSGLGHKIEVHDDESSLLGHGQAQVDESSRPGHKVDDQVDETSRPGHKVDDQVDETSGPGYSQDMFDESLGSGHSDDKVDESLGTGHEIEVHDDESSLSDHSQLVINDQVDESSGPGHKVEVHDDESSRSGHSEDKIDDQVDKSSEIGHSKHKTDESSGSGHKVEVHDDESSRSSHSHSKIDESSRPGHKVEVHDDESSRSGHSEDKIDDQVDKSSEIGHSKHKIDESSGSGHKVEVHDDESSRSGHSEDTIDDQVDESSEIGHSKHKIDESSGPGHKIEVHDFIEENSIDFDIVEHSKDQDHEKQSSAESDSEGEINDQDKISEINQEIIEESSLDSEGRLEIISKSGSEADLASQNFNYNSLVESQGRVNENDLIEDHSSDDQGDKEDEELHKMDPNDKINDDDFIEDHSSESDGEKLCISRSESEHDVDSQDGKNHRIMIDDSDSDSPRLFLSRSESEVESNDGISGKLETEGDIDFVGGQFLIKSNEDTALGTDDEEDDGKSVIYQSKEKDKGGNDSNKELALPIFNNNDNGDYEDDYDDIIDKNVILSFGNLNKDDNELEQDVTGQDNLKTEPEINNEEIQSSYKSPIYNEDDDSQKSFATLQNITWSPLKLNQEFNNDVDDDSISKSSSSSIIDENLVKKSPAKNKIHPGPEPGPGPGANVISENKIPSPVIDHDSSSQSSQGRSKSQLKITSNQVVVSKYTIIKDRPKYKPGATSPAAGRNSSDVDDDDDDDNDDHNDDDERVVKKSKLARAVSPERLPKKIDKEPEYDSEEELIKYMKRKRSMVKTKRKFGGKSLTSPTIEDSLKFVRKKILPFSDYYQPSEDDIGNASMADDCDSSEYSESDYVFDKKGEASYIHYNDIYQYAESKNLQDLYLESAFTFEDLSEDDEIFMMEVPKSIVEKGNLEGQKMKLKKKYLEIGDTRYDISRVEDDEINLVLKDNHYDDSYRIETIQPIKSIIIHQPQSPIQIDEKITEDSSEPKISFPKNLKTRNPLELNKQPIKATSKRKIDQENNSQKSKKLKLIN